MQPEWVSEKNITTSPHTNHATFPHTKSCNLSTTTKSRNLSIRNIARITKRCPENITLGVKCVKLLFTKVLRKYIFFCNKKERRKNSSDNSDSGYNSEKNPTTSKTKHFFFTFSALFEKAIWHIWQLMCCSQGSILQFSRCFFAEEKRKEKINP